MNIPTLILAAIAVLTIVAVAFGLTMAVRSYLRYRGKRVITCPETAHAAVHVNVVNTAREAAFGKHRIRPDQCSGGRSARIADRNASRRLKPTRKVARSGTWSAIGTRARPVPIARSPS